MKLGVVSLQRHPPDVLNWIRYHVDVGVSNFYFWLEDSDELKPILEDFGGQLTEEMGLPVHVYAEIGKPVNRATENNYFDILDRQQAFVNRMIVQARADGVDWVFHIDDDELLHPRSGSNWGDVLKKVDPKCDSIHMTNWEGYSPEQPSGPWLMDSAVRYMPGKCNHLFAAYANGKAATRTTAGQRAHGVHHFTGGKECELPESDGVVLHHESMAMSAADVPPAGYIEKNRLRLTSDLSKIPFPFTHESVGALKEGDHAALERIWTKYRSQRGERYQQCNFTEAAQLPSYSW
jgi:hypothetical protein